MDSSIRTERKWKQMSIAVRSVRRGFPAMLILTGALFGSLLLLPYEPHAYAVLLLIAVSGCGWVGQRAIGVMAGAVATAAVEYFFLKSTMSFRLDGHQYLELTIFGIAAIGIGLCSGAWSAARERLTASRDQFRVLLDGVKDCAVFLLDAAGRVATWNTGAQRMHGYTAEEMLGRSTETFYGAEEIQAGKPKELLAQAAERGSVHIEGWRTRKDGVRFWAEVTITALFDETGCLTGYAKTTRDVTELKSSHEALAAKEEELQVVVESAPDTVLMTDETGTILFVNGRVEQMFGYRCEELLGQKVEVLVPAKYRGGHIGKRVGFQQHPHTRPMGMGLDLNGLRKDGSEFPVEISLSPVKSSHARRFIASVRDISERRNTEQELQNTRLQDLAQTMIRDMDGQILRWNTGMERMYGYTRAEAERTTSHQLLRTIFPMLLSDINSALLRTGYWEGELIHRTKNGEIITVNSSWVLHRDKSGNPWRVIETNADITALKEAEARASELNRLLEQQNADLTKAKELIEAQTQKIAIAAKMSALGEMAGGMAHEINNPMGIIHARASDLMEVASTAENVPAVMVRATMEKIRSTATRVTKITLGLRKFARETRGDPATDTEVREILEETLPFCMERLKQNSVELRIAPIEKSLRIHCRPTEISQVLLNLLNNAVEAIEPLPEKWVEVQARSAGQEVEISVMDSGHGIPKQFRDKMGQPFFTTKEVGHGTGLGLSISKGIVEAHGGHLNLDAECEHTRFVVTLPKATAKEMAEVGR